MLLIGMFDSPYVRRVAVSMQLLDIGYQHANWSVGKDFDRIRAYNPLGRVPTLVLGIYWAPVYDFVASSLTMVR